MKKLFIRALSVMLAVVLTLTAAPLGEWLGVNHSHEILDTTIEAKAAAEYGWPLPTNYGITFAYHAKYKNGSLHQGVDMATGGVSGSIPVYAVCDGTAYFKQTWTVINGVKYLTSYGNNVQIISGNRKIIYAHLSHFNGVDTPITNTKQQSGGTSTTMATKSVTKGDLLGYVGSTGNSSGAHLHFEIRINNVVVDPTGYIDPSRCAGDGNLPTVDFTKDTKYPTPIKAYPKATSGLITVYNRYLTAYSTSTRNIAYSDLCTINAVYTNGYCEVTYPTDNGNHTEYAKWSDFAGGSITPYSWKPSSNMNVYMRSNLSEAFGTVYSTDSCTVVAESGNKLQIIYPITGGYKMGWVNSTSTTVTPEPERQPTFTAGDLVALEGKSIVAVAPNQITISTNPVKYISQGDICILTDFNSSTGYCNVTYPSGSTDVFTAAKTVTVNIPITNFISYNASAISEKAIIPEQLTMYPTQAMTNTVANTTTNWWLDPGDEYTTINCVDGKTELLYYCTQGKHQGYWKLGWAYLDYYWIDLNGYLDNASQGGLMSYGTADIYVNGVKRADDVTDFYSANGTYPRGSTYEITDIRPYNGYTYNGVQSGYASGTLTGNTSVSLNFTKNPVTLAGITVTTNPTKTTYLEGESLNTSGLVVTGNYSDGTNKNVTASCSFSGYTSTPGDKTVTVSYGGKTTAFTVTVESKSPTKIDITSLPTKTSYCINETIDLTGLAVKATYDNGTSATVTNYDVDYDYDTTATAGTKTIKVSYVYNNVEVSKTFNITVQAHSYTSKVTKEPTCTATGVRTYTCSKCSYSYTETIAAKGHTWNGATCTSPQTCSTCGATSGDATGHSFGSWITTTVATCTTAGKQTRTCSKCSVTETKDIAALGHNYSTNYTVDKAATCTTAGSKSQHCSRCSSKQNVTAIPATGHSYTSKVTTVATCTTTGVKTYTCSTCSHSYTEAIAKLGHNYSTSYTVDKAATCTTAGSKSQHCTRCTSTQNVTAIPATGHSYTSKVTTAATCTAAGVRTYTCSTCSHSYTETIAKLGHNYSTSYTIDTAATCTTAGSKSQHCTRCTSTQNVTAIPATGHNYVNGSCSTCGKTNVTTSATITVSSASATADNQVKVAVSLKNNPGITSMLLKVNFDTTKLQLVSVEDCENLGTAFHSNSMNSPFTLSWANDTATTNYTYNGDVVVFTFKIKDGAALGSTPITVTYDYDNYDIIDKDMNPVEFNVVNGSVNIIDVLIGDVNNDGKVNQLDRVILTRYLANWTEYPEGSINTVAADVNCDGKVNTLDRVILTRYIANWTGYESLPYNN